MDFGDQKYKVLFGVNNETLKAKPYVEHKTLLERAKTIRPKESKPTASAFSSWIFDLSHPESRRTDRSRNLLMGREGERRVEYFKAWSNKEYLNEPKLIKEDEWTICYKDPLDNIPFSFQASSLMVNGIPLQCRPDVVLKNIKTNEIIIVERKITKKSRIPKAGWPNAKVQLWCYSNIDKFQSAANIYLSTQIFIFNSGEYRYVEKTNPRWDRDDKTFQKECSELFAEYTKYFGKKALTTRSRGTAKKRRSLS